MTANSINYCPHCGTAVVQMMQFGELHATCPSCGYIHFEDPKVAAGVLVERSGEILLVRRVNTPGQGKWSIPAGFVNAHEDPACAAERECMEETGLKVKITGLANLITGRDHPRGADIVIIYNAEVISGKLAAGDDADQVEFFPRNKLPPLAFRATCIALQVEECEHKQQAHTH